MSKYCVLSKNSLARVYEANENGSLILSRYNRDGSLTSKSKYRKLSDDRQYSKFKTNLKFVSENNDSFLKDFNLIKEAIKSNAISKGVAFNTFKFKGEISANSFDFKGINLDSNYLYGVWDENSGIIGLSPEVIYEKNDNYYLIHSLAGTGDIEKLSDDKIINEHKLVSLGILEDLSKKFDKSEIEILENKIIKYGDLYHLKKHIKLLRPDDQSDELINLLQPTPAIGGYPRESFNQFKPKLNFEREENFMSYGGLFRFHEGSFDRCVVSIRSIYWSNDDIYIHAGCGITKNSEFNDELNESRNKMKNVIKELGLEYQ